MKTIKISTAIISLIILNLNARVLTYDEAISIALKESYTIKSFEKQKEASLFSYQFYKAQFKPRLDLGFMVPSWNERVTSIPQVDGLPVYNSTGSFRYSGDLAFTYMLPTGGNFKLSSDLYQDDQKTILALQNNEVLKSTKVYTQLGISFEQPILTANRKKEDLRLAEYHYNRFTYRFTREQMNIMYEVTRGFYQLFRTTRQVEIAQDRYENTVEALRIAQILEKNGRIPEVDVLISQVEMAEREAELSETINSLEREKDSFKHLIGLSLDEEIDIVTDVLYDTFSVDLKKAIASALEYRMELKEQDMRIKSQEIQVDRAKRISELSGRISAYYDFTGVSTIDDPSTRALFESSAENFLDRNPNRGVTVTLSYPLFDWGRRSARVQEETVYLDNHHLAYEDLKLAIVREVRDIVRSVDEALNRLTIHEKNQKISDLTYQISRMRFENGDINSQELAIQQERLASSQLAYLDAFITYQLQVADLKRKTLWDFGNDRAYVGSVEK